MRWQERSKRTVNVLLYVCIFLHLLFVIERAQGAPQAKEFLASPQTHAPEREIFGFIETVTMYPGKINIDAKISTTLRYSELHAEKIDLDAKQKRATLSIRSKEGKVSKIVVPLVHSRKARSNGLGAVVKIGLCLGTHYLEAHVELDDRSAQDEALALGRETVAGLALIDPSRMKITVPDCKPPASLSP